MVSKVTLGIAILCMTSGVLAEKPKKTANDDFASRMFQTFTFTTESTDVIETTWYIIRGSKTIDGVIVGRLKRGDIERGAAVVYKCDTKVCHGKNVLGYERAKSIKALQVLDLAGSKTKFSKYQSIDTNLAYYDGRPGYALDVSKLTYPTLLVKTEYSEETTGTSRFNLEPFTGTAYRDELHIIDLKPASYKDASRGSLVLKDVGISGVGHSSSYALGKQSKKKFPRQIIESRQHHIDNKSLCLPPKPTKHRWLLVKGYYKEKNNLVSSGCGK